jgi:hypothetical protein
MKRSRRIHNAGETSETCICHTTFMRCNLVMETKIGHGSHFRYGATVRGGGGLDDIKKLPPRAKRSRIPDKRFSDASLRKWPPMLAPIAR